MSYELISMGVPVLLCIQFFMSCHSCFTGGHSQNRCLIVSVTDLQKEHIGVFLLQFGEVTYWSPIYDVKYETETILADYV